jgi:hypothetical protein
VHGNVDTGGLTSDGDQSLVRVGRLTRRGRGSGVGHPDLTRRGHSDLIDLGSSLADDLDCQLFAQVRPSGVPHPTLTGTYKGVRDENLLSLRCGSTSSAIWRRTARSAVPMGPSRSTGSTRASMSVSTTLLTIRAGAGSRVALLIFEENGSDVVNGNVNGIGNTRDREDTLSVSVFAILGGL